MSLATLSAILTAALVSGTTTSRYSAALDLQLRGGAVARSGVDLVIGAIEDPADTLDTILLAADAPHVATIAGIDTELEIQGEGGKLNPARADLALLENYFADTALPANERTALMAALGGPRRDGDSLAALRLVHAYLLPYLDMRHLQRDFGIWNATAGIDPLFASRTVLSAVPDLGDVDALLRARKTDPGSIRSLSRYFAESRPEFCIAATAHWTADSVASHAEAVEITSGGRVLTLSRSCGY